MPCARSTAGCAHAWISPAPIPPSLAAVYPSLVYDETDPALFDGLDLVFCALPHGVSQDLMPALNDGVGMVVDLAADFRLKDPGLYPIWYGEEHRAPELLEQFVYGLPELDRDVEGGHREHATALHPGGGRGARRLRTWIVLD